MSEFTAGFLFLRKYESNLERNVNEAMLPSRIVELNARWGVLLLEDEWLQDNRTVVEIKKLSHQVPLLRFMNGPDHGWGYTVYQGGETRAAVDVSYERSFFMAVEEVERRHPQLLDVYEYMSTPAGNQEWKTIYAEVLASSKYQEAVQKQFQYRNVDAFHHFELTEEHIQKLNELLIADGLMDEESDPREQVEQFKQILEITEMAWMM